MKRAMDVTFMALLCGALMACDGSNASTAPTATPPTASITCDKKTISCDVDTDSRASIAWTTAQVSSCHSLIAPSLRCRGSSIASVLIL